MGEEGQEIPNWPTVICTLNYILFIYITNLAKSKQAIINQSF